MPYSSELKVKNIPLKETESDNTDEVSYWRSQGGIGTSTSDEGGEFPAQQMAGNDKDSLLSFIDEAHLQEAREFRRKGYNSQVPEIDPGLAIRLRETVAAAKLRFSLQTSIIGPLGSQWLWKQTGEIERLTRQLTDGNMQAWVSNELPSKNRGKIEGASLGNRSAAQSLVRRLESALQTLIRVVDILNFIDDYSTPGKRYDMLVSELTNAFSSSDENTVMQGLKSMMAEDEGKAAWSSLVQSRDAAWEVDSKATFSALSKISKHEAGKASKKANKLQGAAQNFFNDIAVYLQSLSSDLIAASANVSQSASPLRMQNVTRDERAALSSRSDSPLDKLDTGFVKQKLQLNIVAEGVKAQFHRFNRILKHGHPSDTLSKTSAQVIDDSIIRSILWQWQQLAIKIQYASSALLSKVDELQEIEGMLLSYEVAHSKRNEQEGSDTSVSHPGEVKMDAQVRQWVNNRTEQAKPENQQTEKLAVLKKLLDGDIVNASKLVGRLWNSEESVQNMLVQQRYAVLKMIILRSALPPSLKAVDALMPKVARGLDRSIAALDKARQAATTRDFAEAKKQAGSAQLLATKFKEKLSTESARLTERPLDEHSRSSRLAKHWANIAREQKLSHFPSPDAEQVFSALKKRELLEGVLSTGDPEGYLFATRFASELENARHDELRLPMSPEQYAALEKGLIEYIVKWGQKRLSRGGTRLIIELAFEQGLDTVTVSLSNLFRMPYKVIKAVIKVPYSVHKINNYTMPGHDKPYKAIYDLLGKKLKQLGFNLITAPLPGVVKLAVGAAVTVGAAVHNLHVGKRENTFNAVYQRVAEGKKSAKIKMDSPGGMLFDSVVDGTTTAVLKGIHRAWKSGKSEHDVIPDAQDINDLIDEHIEKMLLQEELGEEEIITKNGTKLILRGKREFQIAVHKHIEELQKHASGRAILDGLAGRKIEIRPPHADDWLRKEDDGRHYFGSRIDGDSIFFDPYNTYYGTNRDVDTEVWREVDPSIVLYHELLHVYEGDSRHDTIINSDPIRLDENDYRREFYESRNLNVVERYSLKDEGHDNKYASVSRRREFTNSSEREKVKKEIADALANYESRSENQPVSYIKRAIFLDEYLYDKYLNSNTNIIKYRKEWLKIRRKLERINTYEVKKYLDIRLVIESYDEYKSYIKGYREYDYTRRQLNDDVFNLFSTLESNNDPLNMDKAIDAFIAHYARHFDSTDGDVRKNNILNMARIYFLLNKKGGGNKIGGSYLNVINGLFPTSDRIIRKTKNSHINIKKIISSLEVFQSRHRAAHGLVSRVTNIVDIISPAGKSSETLFLDARIISAQLYDRAEGISLVKDRGKWLKRYDNIMKETGNAPAKLFHIEAIIYYLQKNNSVGYLMNIELESGFNLLNSLLINRDRQLKKILHINKSDAEFTSFTKFKSRKELGNDDGRFYSQFDNYIDNQDAEKEAKSQILAIASHLRLSTGELFDEVEDVKVLGYAFKNRNGDYSKAAPGRVIIIKVKGGDAFVISNLFLKEHVRRISKDEYEQLLPIFSGGISGNIVNRAFSGPYYFNGAQKNHTDLTKMLTGMDEEELRSFLKKSDIWLGHPARFSNKFPEQENVQDLKGKMLRETLIRAKGIENNAAASSLRSSKYSLTDLEEAAHMFIPFYEIGHRSETDREYEIDAERFILDLITVVTIVIPGAANISTMIRGSSISSILKSGLKGTALLKKLAKEIRRLGLSTSKIFGTAIYDLVDPFPINSYISKTSVFDEANIFTKSKHFRSDWIDNNPMLSNIHHDADGVYKVRNAESNAMQDYSSYIKKDNNFYPVKYDKDNRTWRLIPPVGSGKRGYNPPVWRNENGEWEPHLDVGLKGGGLKELIDKIRSRNELVIGEYSFKRVPYNKEKLNEMRKIATSYTPTSNATDRLAKIQQDYKTGKEISHDQKYEHYNNLSFEEQIDLFINDDTDAITRGILAGKINEYIKHINSYEIAEGAYAWKASATKATDVILVPQNIFLKGRSGECLPASVLMGRALQTGQEAKLSKKLMDIYSAPDVGASPLYKALVELHADGNSSKFGAAAISDVKVSTLNDANLKLFPTDNVSVRVDIPEHTMLLSKVNKDGKIKYVLYDPNYGLAYFDKYKDLIAFFKDKLDEYRIPESSVKFSHLDYSRVQGIIINEKNLDEIINDGTPPEAVAPRAGPDSSSASVTAKEIKKSYELIPQNGVCFESSINLAHAENILSKDQVTYLRNSLKEEGISGLSANSSKYKKLMDIHEPSIGRSEFDLDSITESGFVNFFDVRQNRFTHTAYIHVAKNGNKYFYNVNQISLDLRLTQSLPHQSLPVRVGNSNRYLLTENSSLAINDFLSVEKCKYFFTSTTQVRKNILSDSASSSTEGKLLEHSDLSQKQVEQSVMPTESSPSETNKPPLKVTPQATSLGSVKPKIENWNINSESQVASMGRPNKNYRTGKEMDNFIQELKKSGVKTVIALDDGMSASTSTLQSNLLKHGINYVSDNRTWIKDFFKYDNGTQPTPRKIDIIVDIMLSESSKNNGGIIVVHCALGDGRSGMIKAAYIMKQKLKSGAFTELGEKLNDVTPSTNKETTVSSYKLVSDTIEEIRRTHPKAVERPDDIKVLNDYVEYLIKQ